MYEAVAPGMASLEEQEEMDKIIVATAQGAGQVPDKDPNAPPDVEYIHFEWNRDVPPRLRATYEYPEEEPMRSRLQNFMDTFHAHTLQHPMAWMQRVVTFDQDPTKIAVYEIRPWEGAIVLQSINVQPTGFGYGRRALKFILDMADEHQVPMTLTVGRFGDMKTGLKKTDLKRWYKRHGFVFGAQLGLAQWDGRREPRKIG